MSMKQCDAVVNAVINVCGESEGAYTPTPEQRKAIHMILIQGFIAGEIQHSQGALSEDAAKKYVGGLTNNHLRKDKRLNGGTKYEAKNPGVRTTSADPQLKNLMALYGSLSDDRDKAEVMAHITARKAELTVVKPVVIDYTSLPSDLLKFKK